jgi:transposase
MFGAAIMRFIQDLTPETIRVLTRIQKHSHYPRVRQRAHCILLSFRGYSIQQMQDIFQVNRVTIYNWLNAWESRCLPGLYDKKGRGRPPLLAPEQKEQIRQWVKMFPKNINKIRLLVKKEFDIVISKQTIKRILKPLHFSWHRIRRKVKGKPDPDAYQQKKEELELLKLLEELGLIDLFYFDESGFCLVPYMSYAWQEQGDPIVVESSKSQRLNILGFMSRQNELQAYSIEGSVTSDIVIDCIDKFCQTVTKWTVVVMDNAGIHKSKAFETKQGEWKKHQVELFFLPPYSPELNLIEILWRFVKYEWIDFHAYASWKTFVEHIETVLAGFGEKYKINFG